MRIRTLIFTLAFAFTGVSGTFAQAGGGINTLPPALRAALLSGNS
jgi:hypothetical protein